MCFCWLRKSRYSYCLNGMHHNLMYCSCNQYRLLVIYCLLQIKNVLSNLQKKGKFKKANTFTEARMETFHKHNFSHVDSQQYQRDLSYASRPALLTHLRQTIHVLQRHRKLIVEAYQFNGDHMWRQKQFTARTSI